MYVPITLSLPLCHHSLLSPAPSLQFNSLSPVKSKLLLLILTEFLLSMVRPATRDWKRCMDSAYVLRFRPVRVRKIGILKHSPDCMLVQQDSSNWPRDSLKKPSHPIHGVPTAINCLAPLHTGACDYLMFLFYLVVNSVY
uniref:Uncharacterized protein n=1 Tax=Glycine max TaxID=3847 RepID=A0A0R0FPH3_SOYBN